LMLYLVAGEILIFFHYLCLGNRPRFFSKISLR